jgi:hypothetical protein
MGRSQADPQKRKKDVSIYLSIQSQVAEKQTDQNHIVKNIIHFDFLLTEESEPRWFFFDAFLFLGSEGGGGNSWPMTNLAT